MHFLFSYFSLSGASYQMNNGISTSVFSALGFGFSLKFPLQFPSGKVPQSYILNSQAWSQMYSSKYLSLLHVTDSTIEFFIHLIFFNFSVGLIL